MKKFLLIKMVEFKRFFYVKKTLKGVNNDVMLTVIKTYVLGYLVKTEYDVSDVTITLF